MRGPTPPSGAQPEKNARGGSAKDGSRLASRGTNSRARSARELRAKPEPRAKPEKKRGKGLGRGEVSPSPEIFQKITLETIHFGAYLKQLFKSTNEMV